MSFLIRAIVNLFRFLRNLYRRAFKRVPDFVWLDVGGGLPEFEPRRAGFLRRRFSPGPTPPSLEAIRARLDALAGDGRVRGVVLRMGRSEAGWASLEELRREVARFRGGGGRVVAYLGEDVDSGSFFLASAADEILATPLATVGVTGVSARVNFLKDALDRVGLKAEVVAVSPYKSAGDRLARNDFSPESREQAQRLLDRRYEELVRAVSEGRGTGEDEARAAIDRAPYAAREAVGAGLLDGVAYEDELPARLGSAEEPAKLREWAVARRALRLPYLKGGGRRVGVVSLTGAIVRGRGRRLPVPLPLIGGEQAGSEAVVAALRAAEKNRRVAAVLFHVESPGGDALASDLIWREVQRINAKKPVVVLMGNVAASGGYYVSAAASRVVARRNTVTGSIGVITIRPVAVGLFEKTGVHPVALGRGARSNLQDPSRRPSEDEFAVLEGQIRGIYREFKDRVSRGREMDLDSLESVAGGRVWTGAEALGLGLTDEIGGFREALARARELGKVEADGLGGVVKVSASRGARPSPGDPVEAARGALAATAEAISGLVDGRAWAMLPFEPPR